MDNQYKLVEFDLNQLFQLFKSINENDILIGGQALSFWVDYYKIDDPYIKGDPLTTDVDILGTKQTLIRISDNLGGIIEYPPASGFGTSLVGQLTIPIGDGKANNVDVLKKVPGLDKNAETRASFVSIKRGELQGAFNVLHPMDCMMNKLYNLVTFSEKQNEKGIKQANLSVMVFKSYIADLIMTSQVKLAITMIENAAKIARSSIGKHNRQYGVEAYKAIPIKDVEHIKSDQFIIHRLPRLIAEINLSKGV